MVEVNLVGIRLRKKNRAPGRLVANARLHLTYFGKRDRLRLCSAPLSWQERWEQLRVFLRKVRCCMHSKLAESSGSLDLPMPTSKTTYIRSNCE